MKSTVLILFVLLAINAMGKGENLKIDKAIAQLELLHKKVLLAPDTTKIVLNNEFKEALNKLLYNFQSLTYDLSKLKSVSVLTDPENRFRIYTWPLEISPGNYDYYGFTQYSISKKQQKVKVVELENSVFNMTHKNDQVYESNQWRGGLYYALVPSGKKKSSTYLMLGWDGFGKRSTKKLIEVISFNSIGEPSFGAPVLYFEEVEKKKSFREKKKLKVVKYKVKYRHEFEYSAKVSMMLRYDEHLKMVVFDHLTPINPKLASVRATYVPDYSYDGLFMKKGKWYFKNNLDLRNETLPKAKKYKPSDVKQ